MGAVILDLDHTLIHTVEHAVTEAVEHFATPMGVVHVRPGARAFVAFLLAKRPLLRVGVWTTGTPDYAAAVLKGLDLSDRLDVVLTRNDATKLATGDYIKDLSVVRARLGVERVVLLDDSTLHALLQPNSVVIVPAFDVHRSVRDDFFARLLAHTAQPLLVAPVPIRATPMHSP